RCDDGRFIGIIDTKPHLFAGDGRPIEPADGELWWPAPCDGPHVVKIGDKFAYADRDLHLVTPAKFEQARGFVNGYAAAKFDGKFGLLRPEMTWAVEPSFDALAPLSNGVALAKANGRFGMIDTSSGSWLTPPGLEAFCSVQSGFVLGITDQKRGFLD